MHLNIRHNPLLAILLAAGSVFVLLSPQSAFASKIEHDHTEHLMHESDEFSCEMDSCRDMTNDCAKHCASQSDSHKTSDAIFPSQRNDVATPTVTAHHDKIIPSEHHSFSHRHSDRAPPTAKLLRSVMKRE